MSCTSSDRAAGAIRRRSSSRCRKFSQRASGVSWDALPSLGWLRLALTGPLARLPSETSIMSQSVLSKLSKLSILSALRLRAGAARFLGRERGLASSGCPPGNSLFSLALLSSSEATHRPPAKLPGANLSSADPPSSRPVSPPSASLSFPPPQLFLTSSEPSGWGWVLCMEVNAAARETSRAERREGEGGLG